MHKLICDFNSISESGKTSSTRDVITDFSVSGGDVIDLSTIDANGSASGNGVFKFLAGDGAVFTGVRGQIRATQYDVKGTANDKTVLSADIDGNKTIDFQIELKGLKVLTASDFHL